MASPDNPREYYGTKKDKLTALNMQYRAQVKNQKASIAALKSSLFISTEQIWQKIK